MIDPKLIILYGRFGDKLHEKQQAMIEGRSNCGYLEYSKKYGFHVYLTPQIITEPHTLTITSPAFVKMFIDRYPSAIIWSVKHDEKKDQLLQVIPNKKIYYSCCSYNMYNPYCDFSLVDTKKRLESVGKNAAIHVKGKDPDYWYPEGGRVYDYVLFGKRGDKNEAFFIKKLTREVPERRSILWIGGEKHRKSIPDTHHGVFLTPFLGKDAVRDHMRRGKVGVILSDIPAEGFPQTFLEMTMLGLPVVYMGPKNHVYMGTDNGLYVNKNTCAEGAELLLRNRDHVRCRAFAVNNYSLDKSFENMRRALGTL